MTPSPSKMSVNSASPSGSARSAGAHHGFRVVLHLLHDVEQRVGAVFRRQRLQPRRGAPVRRHLGAEIAETFGGRADVGEDDRLDGGIRLAVAIQTYRRQAQALAVDLSDRAVAARRGAADVGPMRAHAAEAEQARFVEGRCDDIHVGEMRAALVRIVVDEHVAWRRHRERRARRHAPHRASSRGGSAGRGPARPCCRQCRRCRRSSRRQPSAAANTRSWPGRSSSPRPRRSAHSSPPRSGQDRFSDAALSVPCHCEERSDEAISIRLVRALPDRDCFVAPLLAMTMYPKSIDLRLPSWRHDGRGIHRLDDRRPAKCRARRQSIAPMHRRLCNVSANHTSRLRIRALAASPRCASTRSGRRPSAVSRRLTSCTRSARLACP